MVRSEKALGRIRAHLTAYQDDLGKQLQRVLRETLFVSRAYVRPADLRRIAVAEVDAYFDFLQLSDDTAAMARGAHLCQIGLGEEAVLRMGRALRLFCHTHLDGDLFLPGLEAVDAYHGGLVRGFIQERNALILEEQERIRSALHRAISRYTIQMEVASDIARAATSILDLIELLTTSVDLIREGFDLRANIFLVDEGDEWATLRASGSEHGRDVLRRGYRLKVGGRSLAGWCIAHGEARVVPDVDREDLRFGATLLPETRSQVALPLISRGRVIGAMTIQSNRVAAFGDEDTTMLQTMADQLANAIENARLYRQVQQELADRARAEEESRRAREAAEAANRAKSVFLANMSHELRTPLNAIIGYSELLQEEAEDRGYTDSIPDLVKIRTAGRHLLSIISDILDLSRIEADRVELRLETFDILPLIHDVVITAQPLVEQNGNRLDVHCVDDIGAMHADQTRVRQILFNLLSNAAKFTERGKITLAVAREEEEWIQFTVADTGIGIDPESLPNLFQTFTQAETSSARQYGGAGLGLAISHRFCRIMGGEISVESEVGKGSTFTVRLPRDIRSYVEALQDIQRQGDEGA